MMFWLAIVGSSILGFIVGAVFGFIGPFMLAFGSAGVSGDPSVGGAYFALVFFTIPIGAVVGAIAGPVLMWRLW